MQIFANCVFLRFTVAKVPEQGCTQYTGADERRFAFYLSLSLNTSDLPSVTGKVVTMFFGSLFPTSTIALAAGDEGKSSLPPHAQLEKPFLKGRLLLQDDDNRQSPDCGCTVRAGAITNATNDRDKDATEDALCTTSVDAYFSFNQSIGSCSQRTVGLGMYWNKLPLPIALFVKLMTGQSCTNGDRHGKQ